MFIGIGTRLRPEAIRAALDGCLATPDEMREYAERWEGIEPSMSAWMTHEYLRRAVVSYQRKKRLCNNLVRNRSLKQGRQHNARASSS